MSPVTKVVENDCKDEGGVAGVLANRDSSSDLIFRLKVHWTIFSRCHGFVAVLSRFE